MKNNCEVLDVGEGAREGPGMGCLENTEEKIFELNARVESLDNYMKSHLGPYRGVRRHNNASVAHPLEKLGGSFSQTTYDGAETGGGVGIKEVLDEVVGTRRGLKEVPDVDVSGVQEAIRRWTERVANLPDVSLSFKGFRQAGLVADRQVGPTCGYEALENGIQLMIDDKAGAFSQLSTVMQKMVLQNPVEWGAGKAVHAGRSYWVLPFNKYPKMLGEFKMDSCLSHFSHEKLQRALAENRPVIICGDVRCLPRYDQNGLHAVVVVDWDKQKGTYTIVDSNFEDEICQVDGRVLEQFVNGHLPDELKSSEYGNMVVFNSRAAWGNRSSGGRVSFCSRMGADAALKSIDERIDMSVNRLRENREKLNGWIGRQLNRPIEELEKELSCREIELEIEKTCAHRLEILQDQSDREIAAQRRQTMDQYRAEKLGYKQVYPNVNGFNAGNPNLFTKGDKLYELLPSGLLYQKLDTGYLTTIPSADVKG